MTWRSGVDAYEKQTPMKRIAQMADATRYEKQLKSARKAIASVTRALETGGVKE